MDKTEPNTVTSFLPDFCGVRMVFVVLLIGELLAIILTLSGSAQSPDIVSDLAFISLFIQWMALSSAALLCLNRRWLNNLADTHAATASYLIILVVCLINSELAWWVMHRASGITIVKTETHGGFVLRCMGISAIVSALALRYFYILEQWRRNIRSEAESRIQALQSRIRPHFLFNCMNTIASLTRFAPQLAEEAIEDLSDLFRVSLMDTNRYSTLGQELDLCRRYLRIEAHRLGKRLQVNWDTDSLPLNARMPPLTLQPLVENALYHGIEPLPEGGTIHVGGKLDGAHLVICIDNPLAPDGNTNRRNGNQLAQDNIRQRLLACFGPSGKLELRISPDHYYAEITIPYHVENTHR
jgi:two-component system sensor histidine kinase AlgZ